MGVVINREGPITVAEVLESLQDEHENVPDASAANVPTWWGGPVGGGTGFVVWNGQVADDEGWNIGPDVAVSPSMERLVGLIEEQAVFNLCLGYAGWGPGQLDDEIRKGAWLVVDVDSQIVFNTPLTDRYDTALASLGLRPETIWMRPIDE